MPKSKDLCRGCRDDFYNCGGATGLTNHCWHYDDAQIKKVIRIGYWETPPYIKKPIEKKLVCYRKTGECFIEIPDQKTRKRSWTIEHW